MAKIIRFSNNFKDDQPFFASFKTTPKTTSTPTPPVTLLENATSIATADGEFFDKAYQEKGINYSLAQDLSILAALEALQNQRMAQALLEKSVAKVAIKI